MGHRTLNKDYLDTNFVASRSPCSNQFILQLLIKKLVHDSLQNIFSNFLEKLNFRQFFFKID